ncbi:MAG: DUF177 domain-containing protein [Sphingomonadaceae bacterium]|nr:DUF177 domain-containing protein [Sphingomonadaceae bacterium]
MSAPLEHILTPQDAARQTQPLQLDWAAAARDALVARFDWLALAALRATLSLAPATAPHVGGWVLSGEVAGDVTRACVASGAPVREKRRVPVHLLLLPQDDAAAEDGEYELDAAALDMIYFADGRFDVADLAAESFALALDPWPRAKGADAFLREKGVLSEEEAGSFGALAALRDKMAGKGGD